MRKGSATLLLIGMFMSAAMAWAEAPVVVNHTLTDYSMGTDTVTLHYTVNVKNPGTSSISNVSLTLVPLMIGNEQITLNVEALGPQAEVQVPFTFTTPMLLEQSAFSGESLFWAGICKDVNGNLVEFPATSVQGGAL